MRDRERSGETLFILILLLKETHASGTRCFSFKTMDRYWKQPLTVVPVRETARAMTFYFVI